MYVYISFVCNETEKEKTFSSNFEMEISHGFGNGGNRKEQYLENLLAIIIKPINSHKSAS